MKALSFPSYTFFISYFFLTSYFLTALSKIVFPLLKNVKLSNFSCKVKKLRKDNFFPISGGNTQNANLNICSATFNSVPTTEWRTIK